MDVLIDIRDIMEIEMIIKKYSEGKSLNQISDECGISIPTLAKKLRAMNIYVKSRKDRWKENHNQIIKRIMELQNGKIKRLSYTELAKELGVNRKTIAKHMEIESERELSQV